VATLSRADILGAFESLERELARRGARGEFFVLGGAAMVLLYDARSTTRDVDMLPAPGTSSSLLADAARHVADDLGLPGDWLNDGAKGFVHGLAPGADVYASGALRVRSIAPEQLLAMKLCAWRDDVDVEDARLLLAKLEGSKDSIRSKVERHVVPGRELKARLAFDDLWESRHGPE
jgi:hypothetical protein